MSDFARFNLPKLNGENYSIWSKKVEMLLIKDRLWCVLSKIPPTDPKELEAWNEKDDQARATIGLLIEDNQWVHIEGAGTAKEAWSKLKDHHQKATLSNVVYLYRKMFQLRLPEGGDMENHISELLTYSNKLCQLGEKIDEKLKAALLLSSIPDSYSALISSLESKSEDEFTLDFVKGRLMDEFKRRKNNESGPEDSSESALKAKFGNGNRSNNQSNLCFFCEKPGHIKSKCLKFKAYKKKKAEEDKANKVTTKSKGYSEKQKDDSERAKAAVENKIIDEFCFKVSSDSSSEWCVDSGATSHMTCSKNFFSDLDLNVKGQVQLAEKDSKSQVHGVGSGVIKCDVNGKMSLLEVENVLYVPSFESSLLSVKKLVKDGHDLLFSKSSCKIVKNGEIKAIANLGNNVQDLFKVKTIDDRACTAIKVDHGRNCIHAWHRRFGHRDPKAIKSLVVKRLADGISIQDCGKIDVCDSCVRGKMHRLPFPKESVTKTKAPLDLIHTDVCGAMQTTSPGGSKYILTIIDDYSRYTVVYFLKHKNETNTFIKQFVESAITQRHKTPKIIRSDRGGEYVNRELQKFLKDKGIKVEYTVPDSPEQNGVAERKNRSLLEMARCMLIDAEMENKFWSEAVNTANYLQNRLPTSATEKTPYELWFLEKPKIGNLHIFGTDAYAHVPKKFRRKLDDKAEKLTFVGYSDESKGYRLLDKSTGKIKTSRDVIFTDKCEHRIPVEDLSCVEIRFQKVKDNETSEVEGIYEGDSSSVGHQSQQEIDEADDEMIRYEESISGEDQSFHDENEEEIQEGVQNGPRRSSRENRGVPPDRYMQITKLVTETQKDPTTVKEACTGPHKLQWKEAMEEEIRSLQENGTWEIVPTPKGKNIVSCKWVFKTKEDTNEGVVKYKARLVARGFSQKFGTDYDEVFAPVVRQTTFKVLLAVAGKQKLVIKHFDAKTAFPNGRYGRRYVNEAT